MAVRVISPVRPRVTLRVAVAEPDFRTGALALNAVLRWEYRLGSTLFLVYRRGQTEPEWDGDDGPAPRTLRPWALALGPTTDTILVKWSHRLSR
jgi:hypothetical protein